MTEPLQKPSQQENRAIASEAMKARTTAKPEKRRLQPDYFKDICNVFFKTCFMQAGTVAEKVKSGDIKLTEDNIRWLSKSELMALREHGAPLPDLTKALV